MLATTQQNQEDTQFAMALLSATRASVGAAFDDAVISAVIRPANWIELVVANVRILAPAIACGVCLMLTLVQFSFQCPCQTDDAPKDLSAVRPLDIDRLMRLIDKQGQYVASATLLRQSMADSFPWESGAVKVERRPKLRAAASSAARIV